MPGAANRWRALMAGRAIAASFRLVLTQVVGDWKWLREQLGLAHCYACREVSHLCVATKLKGMNLYCNFRRDGPISRRRTQDEFLVDSRDLWLSKLPGVCLYSIYGDFMHIVMLGLLLIVSGSSLCGMASEGFWGLTRIRRREIRLNLQLRLAHNDFQRWRNLRRLVASQPQFTLARLSCEKSRQVPALKAKAMNSMIVCAWLQVRSRQSFEKDATNVSKRLRWTLLWSYVALRNLLRNEGLY